MSCELKTLRVYRGYPTLFNGNHWLSVSFNSETTITGWGAKFVLDNITKTYQNVQSGFYVDLTAQETAGLKNGLLNGTLILIDTSGNEHPFATDIPVMSSDWVDGAMELDNFDLTVNVEIQENELEIKIQSASVSQEIIDLINSKQPILTSANAGDGISITGTGSSVVISNTQTSAEWGNITGDIADQDDLQEALDAKLDKNSDILGGTHTKITYDSKGLVTGGSDLSASDIPNLSLSKISDVTATASEVNVLDGITATTTELNYCDGVTSNIQTQLNGKLGLSSSSNIVYGTDGSGNQQLHGIVYNAATAWSIARRNGNGQVLVGAPTADTHAATKKYVDDIVGNIEALLAAI